MNLSVVVLLAVAAAAERPAVAVAPFESAAPAVAPSRIDVLVFAKHQQLGIVRANPCSDEVFVRRVYLDVIGTLPTADEVKAFLKDTDSEKRRKLIDALLEREEYADYWAMKWSDLLRIKAEFPINLWPNAAQAYHRWVRTAIRDNMPYDRFVRELLCSSGSNFRVPQVNFYRAVQSRDPATIAQAAALTFMGQRADKWPKERQEQLAAFFSQIGYKTTIEWKEEIVRFDPDLAEGTSARRPTVFPDGTKAIVAPGQDPREVFADWLIRPENPFFARAIVNRVWAWLLGRGIVHEPDDFRPDNPPSNPELLAYLEGELVRNRFDLKQIYRLILNSQTYQLSSISKGRHPQAESQFAYYPPRRLEAEVLIDAINQITGTTEKYSSAIPEPFTFIPENCRSIALPDGSITSSFLELFGKPPRDSGLEGERNNRLTAAQRLHLLNSSHIQRKIDSMVTHLLSRRGAGQPREIAENLYLTILSRYPTADEWQAIARYAQGGKQAGREVAADLAWALINSTEFLYRH